MNRLFAMVLALVMTMGATVWMASRTRLEARDADGAAQANAAAAERGKYLVNAVGGCNDCHTPAKMGPNGPEPDMTRFLAGHHDGPMSAPAPPGGPWLATASATFTAWSGPWGISYTANLTPDNETGLGTWTEQQFIDTIRNGRHQGRGRELLPPMPWMVYRQMNDDDLKAIYAYLRTIPAVRNKVPEPLLAGAPPS